MREGETREVELEGRDLLHFDERNVPPERNKKAAPNPRNKEEKGKGRLPSDKLGIASLQHLAVLPLCLYSIPPFC